MTYNINVNEIHETKKKGNQLSFPHPHPPRTPPPRSDHNAKADSTNMKTM